MVERAGNTSGANNTPLVKFVYTDDNGQQQTKRLYLQEGLIFKFTGTKKNENSSYTVGEDGKVRDECGKVVNEINLSKDQIGALMGIATFDQKDNTDPVFEISDSDIISAMNYESGYVHDAIINDYLSNLGSDKEALRQENVLNSDLQEYYEEYGSTPATFGDARGFVETEITGADGSSSSVKITSKRLEEKYNKQVEERRQEFEQYKKEHPIRAFFGIYN